MCNVLAIFIPLLIAWPALADKEPRDGRYEARVRTDSGTYLVPVEAESGEVTRIIWPNGGCMRLRGAEINGAEAYGENSDGSQVGMELEDLVYDDSDSDED